MQAARRNRNRAALVLAVVALAVLDSASGDDSGGATTRTSPSVATPDTAPTTAAVSSITEAATPTTVAPTAPAATEPSGNTATYHVDSIVTLSDTIGVGNEATATWTIVFGCDDGRCDAEVRTGGPRGTSPPFVVTYRPDSEEFTLAETVVSSGDQQCPDADLIWEIVPGEWDGRGPVTFTYTLQTVLHCASGDVRVDWEGSGVRS